MKNRGAALAAAGAAVVVGLLVLLLATSETQRTNSIANAVVGEVAPIFAGTTTQGEPFDLSDQRGRWVVVNFFASWCIECRVEHPELIAFSERHGSGGDVELVSVMFSDSVDRAQEFFEELGGDWPVLVEDMGSVAIDFGVVAVPETYLVSPSGRVEAKWISTVTADELDRVIAARSGGG